MKSADYNTRKGEIMSFKKKFKLFTEISILLPAENTSHYCFTCTQCTRSYPETKRDSLKLCHLPQLIPYSVTPQYILKIMGTMNCIAAQEFSPQKRDLACTMISVLRKKQHSEAASHVNNKKKKKKEKSLFA